MPVPVSASVFVLAYRRIHREQSPSSPVMGKRCIQIVNLATSSSDSHIIRQGSVLSAQQ